MRNLSNSEIDDQVIETLFVNERKPEDLNQSQVKTTKNNMSNLGFNFEESERPIILSTIPYYPTKEGSKQYYLHVLMEEGYELIKRKR